MYILCIYIFLFFLLHIYNVYLSEVGWMSEMRKGNPANRTFFARIQNPGHDQEPLPETLLRGVGELNRKHFMKRVLAGRRTTGTSAGCSIRIFLDWLEFRLHLYHFLQKGLECHRLQILQSPPARQLHILRRSSTIRCGALHIEGHVCKDTRW